MEEVVLSFMAFFSSIIPHHQPSYLTHLFTYLLIQLHAQATDAGMNKCKYSTGAAVQGGGGLHNRERKKNTQSRRASNGTLHLRLDAAMTV